MDKVEFLRLLEDRDIQGTIIDIIANSKNSDNSKKSQLKKELLNAKEQIEVLNKKLQEKEDEMMSLKELIKKFKNLFKKEESKNLELKNTLEDNKNNFMQKEQSYKNKIETLENELKKLKEYCNEEIEIYNLYKSLDSNIKDSLSGIFKDSTFQGFLACGVQEKNVDSFYEYLKSELIEQKKQKELIEIFNFFQKRFLLAYPIYKLQNVDEGSSFDTQEHIKVGQNTRGDIKEVLINGWFNSKTNKIIKKSIVRI